METNVTDEDVLLKNKLLLPLNHMLQSMVAVSIDVKVEKCIIWILNWLQILQILAHLELEFQD